MKKLIAASTLLLIVTIVSQAQSCFTLSWEGNGFDHMNIYVTSATMNGTDLQSGDIIGVFDGSTCVGIATLTGVLTGTAYLSVYASKDDPDTPEKDGYTEGNPISFRYCLSGGTVELTDVQTVYTSGSGIFSVSGTSVVQLQATSQFTINASAGVGGTITPSGEVAVIPGTDQLFTITPDVGYEIADVLVDGESVGAVTEYTFPNVSANHTISASFTALTSIALNKPASAQSAIYSPSKANDDNKLTYWAATPYPQWWKVDLENVYDITGIVLRNHVDGGRYYQYTIEASTDDITYTPVVTKDNTSPAVDEGDSYVVSVTARYLRVTTTYNSANQAVFISDFKVYGVLHNYIILSNTAGGGQINPSGDVAVPSSSDQLFTITPDVGYEIAEVLVDGESVGAVTEYTFPNVSANHTISASFTALTSIALDKPASAQSAIYSPSKANDDDKLTYWAATPYPQWWKVDLENVYDITGIVLRNHVDGGRYYQYTIEASTDDITYTPVVTKDNTSPAVDEGDSYVVSVTARYLRVTTTYNSANQAVFISDFRVYGTLSNELKSSTSLLPEAHSEGINNIHDAEIELNVFPNPFIETFIIEVNSSNADDFNISVIDINGRLVYAEHELPCNERNEFNLKVKKGLYIVRINVNERVFCKRIIKL